MALIAVVLWVPRVRAQEVSEPARESAGDAVSAEVPAEAVPAEATTTEVVSTETESSEAVPSEAEPEAATVDALLVVVRRSACPVTARALGPSQAGFLDGMLGVPRRACLRSEVSIAGDAYLIARPADFYGNIRIGARVSGSVVVDRRVEVWGSFEALRYQSLISAVSSTYLGLGYLSLGTTVQLLDEEDRVWAAYVRTQLPTTSGLDQGSQPLGLEVGTTGEWSAHPNLRLHAFLSVFGSLGISDIAPPLPRGGVRVGGGLDWIPYEWLSFMLEVQSGFGYRDGLDFLALSGGARLGLGDVIGVDLNVIWPFVGAELALAGAQLGVSGRIN